MQQGSRWLPALAATVLAAAVCQVGLGARFSPSGEQLGMALPLSSLVLAAGAAVCMAVARFRLLPTLSPLQTALLATVPLGLLGLPRAAAAGGLKELLQVLEMTVLAAGTVEFLARRGLGERIARILAALGVALLALGAAGLTGHPLLRLSDAKYAAFVILAWPFLLLALQNRGDRLRHAALAAGSIAVGATFQNGGLLLVWLCVFALARLRLKTAPLRLWLLLCLLAVLASVFPAFHARNPWQLLNPRHDSEHLSRSTIELRAALQAPRYYPLGGGLGRYKSVINELKQYQPWQPHPNDTKVPRDGNSQYLVTLVESGIPAAVALLLLLLSGARKTFVRPESGSEGDAARGLAFAGALLSGCFCVLVSRGTCIWLGALLGLANAAAPAPALRTRCLRWAIPALAVLAAVLLMSGVNRQAEPPRGVTAANLAVRRCLFGERGMESLGLRIVTLPDALPGPGLGDVRVEAESCQELGPPFEVVVANDASGSRALAVAEGKGKDNGFARFTVQIPEDGAYILYARVYWEDGCSNSLLFELGDDRILLASDTFLRWHTLDSPRRLRLRKGALTVTLRNPEDGIRVDYWGFQRAGAP